MPKLNSDYSIHLGFNALKNLFWYIVWLFNIPEELKYQTIISRLSFTYILMKDAGLFLYPLIFSSVLSILSLIVLLKHLNIKYVQLLFTIILFGTSLLPIIFFTTHTYTYYLTVPLLVILLFFAIILKTVKYKTNSNIYLTIFLFFWLLSSYFNVHITKKLHWIYKEQQVSKEFVLTALSKYKNIPTNSTIVLIFNTRITKQALQDQQAVQVIYNDRTLSTLYQVNIVDQIPEIKTNYVVKTN